MKELLFIVRERRYPDLLISYVVDPWENTASYDDQRTLWRDTDERALVVRNIHATPDTIVDIHQPILAGERVSDVLNGDELGIAFGVCSRESKIPGQAQADDIRRHRVAWIPDPVTR